MNILTLIMIQRISSSSFHSEYKITVGLATQHCIHLETTIIENQRVSYFEQKRNYLFIINDDIMFPTTSEHFTCICATKRAITSRTLAKKLSRART